MTRNSKTIRMEAKVESWVIAFSDENDVHQSDVINRALKVYAAKLARGEWSDPKFEDGIDKTVEQITD